MVPDRGFKGKKTKNSNTMFGLLFETKTVDNSDEDSVDLDTTNLDSLEKDQKELA